MNSQRMPRATVLASLLALFALVALAGCGDDDTPAVTGTSLPTTTTEGEADGDAAILIVRAFAEEQVSMVDAVIGDPTPAGTGSQKIQIEVRTRREGGAEDPTLTPTIVTLRPEGGTWVIESATSDHLTLDSPPARTRWFAGSVTASGTATAFEGNVVVKAIVDGEVVAEEPTTAEGIQNAAWELDLELGDTRGDGYVLAHTTSGTDLGPPVFALVEVSFGQP